MERKAGGTLSAETTAQHRPAVAREVAADGERVFVPRINRGLSFSKLVFRA